jgi:hypothetical protein
MPLAEFASYVANNCAEGRFTRPLAQYLMMYGEFRSVLPPNCKLYENVPIGEGVRPVNILAIGATDAHFYMTCTLQNRKKPAKPESRNSVRLKRARDASVRIYRVEPKLYGVTLRGGSVSVVRYWTDGNLPSEIIRRQPMMEIDSGENVHWQDDNTKAIEELVKYAARIDEKLL